MHESSHDIRVLNGLIATTIDSIDGYRESAKEIESSDLKQRFEARAGERQTMVGTLRQQVSSLGGNPEDDGTVLAAGHRAFVDLKAAVTGRDDKAIVNEVERGEDHIKAKYEAALQDAALSAECRSLVQMAYGSVKSGHDQMRDLKHNLDA